MWVTFIAIAALYVVVAVTLVLILRMMSRRFSAGETDHRPRRAVRPPRTVGPRRRSGHDCSARSDRVVSEAVAVVLFFGVTAYALFGGADFGSGFWDLTAGGAEKGARPRAVVSHSIGPVWEANHVWLIFILVVMWTAFSEAFASIMLTLFVPLTLAALGIVLRGLELRVPQGSRTGFVATQLRRRLCDLVGLGSVLPGRGGRRSRIGAGAGRGYRRRHVVELDQSHVDPRRRARRHRVRLPRRRVHGVGREPFRRSRDVRVLPAPGRGDGCRGRGRGNRGDLRAPRRRRISLRQSDRPRPPAGDLVRRSAVSGLWYFWSGTTTSALGSSQSAPWSR